MKSYLRQSSEVLGAFAGSNCKDVLREVLDGSRDDLKIASSTRQVYRVGPFHYQGQSAYAAVKIAPDPRRIPVLIEARFIAECSRREEVGVPKFVFAARHKDSYAMVMEDLSEGGRLQVTELIEHGFLPFKDEREFRRRRFEHLHGTELTYGGIHLQSHPRSSCPWTLLGLARDFSQTSFVVHEESKWKRIVVADADQLVDSFICLPPSSYRCIENLVLDL